MDHSHKQVTVFHPLCFLLSLETKFMSPNELLSLFVIRSAPFTRFIQEQELLARISELQTDVCSRCNRITDLDHEIHSLNETIDTLTRELEIKGKEVLRVRSEANQQIRYISHSQRLRCNPDMVQRRNYGGCQMNS